jgi:hypothetical protein
VRRIARRRNIRRSGGLATAVDDGSDRHDATGDAAPRTGLPLPRRRRPGAR